MTEDRRRGRMSDWILPAVGTEVGARRALGHGALAGLYFFAVAIIAILFLPGAGLGTTVLVVVAAAAMVAIIGIRQRALWAAILIALLTLVELIDVGFGFVRWLTDGQASGGLGVLAIRAIGLAVTMVLAANGFRGAIAFQIKPWDRA